MTKTPHRTRPLDRDGDGRDGGSLPGNQTAPMVDAGDPNRPQDGPPNSDATPPEQPDDLADARTTPGDGPDKLEAMERETDEANAEARAERPDDLGADRPETFDEEQVQAAGDTGDAATAAQQAHEVAVANLSEGDLIDEEGESTRPAGADAVTIPDQDPLITLDTDTAPVAVRARDLSILVESGRLYRSEQGYSATYGAPFIDQETADAWIKAGLAEYVPSAGRMGGLRVLAEARRQLTLIRHAGSEQVA